MANRLGRAGFSAPRGPSRGNYNNFNHNNRRPANPNGVGKYDYRNQNGPMRDQQFTGYVSSKPYRKSWRNDSYTRFRPVSDLYQDSSSPSSTGSGFSQAGSPGSESAGSSSSASGRNTPEKSSPSTKPPGSESDSVSSGDEVRQAMKAPTNLADSRDSKPSAGQHDRDARDEDSPRARPSTYTTEACSYSFHDAHRALSKGEQVRALMRQTDIKRPRHQLRVGTIISGPFHSQCREQIVSDDDVNVSISGYGAVYSKYRKMVIIEEWAEHVTCLPVYSYQSRGLETRQGLVDEYVDIRDADDMEPAPKQTEDEAVLATRSTEWDHRKAFISGRSVVKLTEKVMHHRSWKCSVEGRIVGPNNLKKLISLHVQRVQDKARDVFNERTGSDAIPDMIDEFGRTRRKESEEAQETIERSLGKEKPSD